jgi:hypothetical protein
VLDAARTFSDPDIGGHLTFKGGTSLSKAWKLIERFSEDIDLIVDKEVLGFGGDAAPDKAPSNKQRKARLEGLMDACRDWVQETLQPALASRIQSALGETGWQLEVDPDMPDGQCLLFHTPPSSLPALRLTSAPSSKSNSAHAPTIGPMRKSPSSRM